MAITIAANIKASDNEVLLTPPEEPEGLGLLLLDGDLVENVSVASEAEIDDATELRA
jgi:hypothetical protein